MSVKKDTYLGAKLSYRQSQCLYHLLRGKSAAVTGKILGLSQKTVEYYIDEIKNKMMCGTKTEIIEKSIERGYFDIIPILRNIFTIEPNHDGINF